MTRRALVVNCSAPSYNLGVAKLADWLRSNEYDVTTVAGDPGLFGMDFDLVALSVIFSWHAPIAREIALRVKDHAAVWCGGPGMSALINWWRESTGLEAVKGLDARFERQRGDYPFTFAARGCPVGCSFCIVPLIEGLTFTLDWGFRPAPTLCDNNLSALPVEFQEHIFARYAESGMPLKDCNSGFEPRTFDEGTFARWTGKFKGAWRFAFDEQKEAADVRRMMVILAGVNPRKKQVYVLVGNESIASCYDRAMNVIAWGGEPYVQPRMRLNVLSRDELWLSDDWTTKPARDFQRYFNTHLWRQFPITEYRPRIGEPPPFRDIARERVA